MHHFLCYEKCVTEKGTCVNKGQKLLSPYILMLLLSIPFNHPNLSDISEIAIQYTLDAVGLSQIFFSTQNLGKAY